MFRIVILGVVPTYLALEPFNWLWWVGYAFFLIACRVMNGIFSDIPAAFNIAMAQATIITLDEDEQRDVEAYAKQMHSVFDGDPGSAFEDEIQKFAYLALAMHDMEIDPKVIFKTWCDVKNPSKVPPAYMISHVMKKALVEIKSASETP